MDTLKPVKSKPAFTGIQKLAGLTLAIISFASGYELGQQTPKQPEAQSSTPAGDIIATICENPDMLKNIITDAMSKQDSEKTRELSMKYQSPRDELTPIEELTSPDDYELLMGIWERIIERNDVANRVDSILEESELCATLNKK